MTEPISCNNCVCQNVCKAYIDLHDMIKMFNHTNGSIAKIPFKAEILASECPNYLSPTDIKSDLLTLTTNTSRRNEKLTDAYLKLSARYWDMLNKLTSRETRLDLVTQQLKNYVPDHWLFEEDSAGDAEDNSSEPEPDPQMGFDFGDEFNSTKH